MAKKKRTPKRSQGIHGGGGKVTLTESQRTAAIGGGVIARFKPVGHLSFKRDEERQ